MRAPPLSFSPMIGAPTFIAMSMILQIWLCACRSDSEPPNTVKSWLNTNTSRPWIVPLPVTTPRHPECAAAPSRSRCNRARHTCRAPRTSPRPAAPSRRSRAVSLPLACCAAIRFSPPPIRAARRRRSSSAILADMRSPHPCCRPKAADRVRQGQRIKTSSSAIVGWMATVASKSALVSPAFTATAAACMISGASGPIMCTPTMRSLSPSQIIL